MTPKFWFSHSATLQTAVWHLRKSEIHTRNRGGKSGLEVIWLPELEVYFIRNEYCIRLLLPHTMFGSVLHPVRQTQRSKRLGLAHQGHNGAGGGILDLSYSWGTMSMWLLHRDWLLAPNAISPTNHTHTHVCVRLHETVHTCTFSTGHEDSARLAVSQIIITQMWFGSRVFRLQFPLLKKSDTHLVQRGASGLLSIYRQGGNLKGGWEVCVIGVCLMTVLMAPYITTGARTPLYQ